jgi:hypothetical protein
MLIVCLNPMENLCIRSEDRRNQMRNEVSSPLRSSGLWQLVASAANPIEGSLVVLDLHKTTDIL